MLCEGSVNDGKHWEIEGQILLAPERFLGPVRGRQIAPLDRGREHDRCRSCAKRGQAVNQGFQMLYGTHGHLHGERVPARPAVHSRTSGESLTTAATFANTSPTTLMRISASTGRPLLAALTSAW